MKISFCTTCFNRLGQLRETFDANAAIVAREPDVEWCIVDFGSEDGAEGFMRKKAEECCERIVFLKELSQRPWHASVAKNIAHRQGRGEILVGLDCDNFIGDAVETVRRHFAAGCKLLHLWSGELGDGTCGRIAIDRNAFYALGGYDESFFPMGYQDFDLVRRARASGLRVARAPSESNVAIRNSKEESVKNCAQNGLSWADYNDRNRTQSLANIAAGRFVANGARGWAPMKVAAVRIERSDTRVAATSPGEKTTPRESPWWSRLLDFRRSEKSNIRPSVETAPAPRRAQKTVLVAWELGRGMGHINRLLPLASALAAQGHHVVFAFRSLNDVNRIPGMLARTDILQAPVYRPPVSGTAEKNSFTHNYADILLRCGYQSASTLEDLVRRWHQLFAMVGPDVILCDHSPTVVLAAADRIPTLHIGSGFANPPAGKPLLALSSDAAEGAEKREAEVLGSIGTVCRSFGHRSSERVADLFSRAEVFVTCLPELDPYRRVRDRPALGPVQKLPGPLPPGDRAFVFGYLAGQDARVSSLLLALMKAKIPCSIYVREVPPEWERTFGGSSVRLFEAPQRLPEALTAASAVLHHGGLSTTEMALAAGRPQFLLPRYLEQLLTADAVEGMSCGVNLVRRNANAAELIREALRTRKLTSAADVAAAQLNRSPRPNVMDTILRRCAQHLA